MRTSRRALAIGLMLGVPAWAVGQESSKAPSPPLFEGETPIVVTLTADLGRLRGDEGQNTPWRAGTLSYQTGDGKHGQLPLRLRTRGIWRRTHCAIPPLRLDFGKEAKNTPFAHLGHPKLTSFCRDNARYEQYILQELQLYRIYRLLTPASHRVRLLRVTYVDSATGRAHATRYGFMVEDPERLAARLGGVRIKTEGATPAEIDNPLLALAYVFEYMIGNTDFSFNRVHNTVLVQTPMGQVVPSVYDFDFAGAVNTLYATPDPQTGLKRVRDRAFRGYCALNDAYPAAFAAFRDKKDVIYALYSDEIGRLLEPDVVKETREYFDEFYDAIKEPEAAQRLVARSCVRAR